MIESRFNRREMLFGSMAGVATCLMASLNGTAETQKRLLIDTHLEVWTLDPKFPFNHPERGQDLKVDVAAPIENQVVCGKTSAIRSVSAPSPLLR